MTHELVLIKDLPVAAEPVFHLVTRTLAATLPRGSWPGLDAAVPPDHRGVRAAFTTERRARAIARGCRIVEVIELTRS